MTLTVYRPLIAGRPVRFIRVTLAVGRPLSVYADQQTFLVFIACLERARSRPDSARLLRPLEYDFKRRVGQQARSCELQFAFGQ
jgi:hypothetical protein